MAVTKPIGRQGLLTLWLYCFFFVSFAVSAEIKQPLGYLLSLNGAIGPASSDFVARGLHKAEQEKANFVIIILDTPGGLEKSMRSIVTDIIDFPLPVITYVAPSGARAASAGTFILYASHVAAMAPGTNIGAATPVSLTSSENNTSKKKSAAEIKATNDASAYIRSLAQLRHRNIRWAEEAVVKGVSISADEALALGVIDVEAMDLKDLMAKINGRKVVVKGRVVELNTIGYQVKGFAPDWRTQFLRVITDPNVAYILLLVGIYGLLFEFLNPGLVLPGVAGLISLLVALYAFQLLPINYVGLALILVGIAFIIAEAYLPSFGALGVGGTIAFILGSIMLIDSTVPGYTLLLPVIIAVALVTVGFLLFIIQLAIRSQKKPVVSGREELIGSEGEIVIVPGDDERPRVRIRGELWQVRSSSPLKAGDRVKVTGIEELILIVTPVDSKELS